jgi:hypothetical protein
VSGNQLPQRGVEAWVIEQPTNGVVDGHLADGSVTAGHVTVSCGTVSCVGTRRRRCWRRGNGRGRCGPFEQPAHHLTVFLGGKSVTRLPLKHQTRIHLKTSGELQRVQSQRRSQCSDV